MPPALSRRRCLQGAALLPLSGCATPDSRDLSSVHGALSTDGQRLQLVLRVEESRRLTRLLAHHDTTQVLSRRVLALELPAQPAVFQTTEPLRRAWAARPGYAAFADALQANEPLPSDRRGPAGQPYILQLLHGRWLLALLQNLQPSHRHWGYVYDLRDDRMTALPRVPRQEPDGPFTRVNVREAALGAQGWQLWLQHPDCAAGGVVHEVLDLPSGQRWPIQGATRSLVNLALAKAWDAAGRRLLLLDQEGSEVLQLPERLVLRALTY